MNDNFKFNINCAVEKILQPLKSSPLVEEGTLIECNPQYALNHCGDRKESNILNPPTINHFTGYVIKHIFFSSGVIF